MPAFIWTLLLILSFLWGGSFFFVGVAVTEVPRSTAQRKSRAAYERARNKQALGA